MTYCQSKLVRVTNFLKNKKFLFVLDNFLIDLSVENSGIVCGRETVTNWKDPNGSVRVGSNCLQYPDASDKSKYSYQKICG